MLKKLIIIENEETIQKDTFEEIVKVLIDEDYYYLNNEEKINKMKLKAYANCLNNKMEVIEREDIKDISNIKNKFIIKDEITFVLSLLITNNIMILERIDSDIFTKSIDKKSIKDNYIIVNRFAEDLLKKYVQNH